MAQRKWMLPSIDANIHSRILPLKGALTYVCIRFEPTHRPNLLAALLPPDWEERQVLEALSELSRQAVEARQPDTAVTEITEQEALRAVAVATEVCRAIQHDLEAHGFPSQQPRSASEQPPTGEPPPAMMDDESD